MKGPESRKKFFLNYENLCHCEIHPLCTSGSERKFRKMCPWGAVYVTSRGDGPIITAHAPRERGKVIGCGVHIYIYI